MICVTARKPARIYTNTVEQGKRMKERRTARQREREGSAAGAASVVVHAMG